MMSNLHLGDINASYPSSSMQYSKLNLQKFLYNGTLRSILDIKLRYREML